MWKHRPGAIVAVVGDEPPGVSIFVHPPQTVIHSEAVERIAGIGVLGIEEQGRVGPIPVEHPAGAQAALVEGAEVVFWPDASA